MLIRQDKTSQAPALALLVYTALLTAASVVHTYWRDETQAWLIARDSPSLAALLRNTRYEGHPPLWHLILYPLAHLSRDPEWMKLPNLLFAVIAAAILLYTRRLHPLTRLGCAFSYFVLFEYAVIDRNYMIGIALLLGATALAVKKKSASSPAIPLLLSLAALTSLPALILSLCLFALYLAQAITNPQLWHPASIRALLSRPFALLASIVFLVSTLTSVLLIRPPSDTGVFIALPHLTGGTSGKFIRAGKYFAESYLPLPSFQHQFWDTTVIGKLPMHLGSIIGWCLIVALLLFFRRRAASLFFSAATILLLLQVTISGRPYLRHVGWLFVAFLLALFLEHADGEHRQPISGNRARRALLAGILTVQVASGLFAVVTSLRYPFSPAKQIASLLRERHLQDAPLLCEPDYISSSVLAYLQRPTAYDFETQRLASFVVWNRTEFLSRHTPTPSDLEAARAAYPSPQSPVLIVETPLTNEQQSMLNVKPLATYNNSINDMDNYYLYH